MHVTWNCLRTRRKARLVHAATATYRESWTYEAVGSLRICHYGRGGIRTRDTGLPYTRFPVVDEHFGLVSPTVVTFNPPSG
jgi:hypothetical protein